MDGLSLKNTLIGIFCLAALVLGSVFWKIQPYSKPAAMDVTGQANRSSSAAGIAPVGGIETSPFHFLLSPIYRQNDPQWADDTIGGSHEPLALVGCTVSAVSMALAHYGIDLSPKKLNARIKKLDGYTGQGWLKWNTVTDITDGTIVVRIPRHPAHNLIDEALLAQRPVIAKVLLDRTISHWVLIVGKTGQEYLIKDPLGPGDVIEKLSKFQSDIYAIRIVEYVGGDDEA